MPDKPHPQISDKDPAGAYARLDRWLRHRRRYTLIGLMAIAFLLRVLCFLELSASPCFWLHEWDQTDLNAFHSWALTIADGDWWFESVRPPLHDWHRTIAEDYARQFPEQWAELQAANPSDDPDAAARALWYGWCGGGRTYQGPLYPYLVAVTYHLLGPAVGWVYVWQMALGMVSIVLVHVLTRRYFDDVAALLAAALTLLYGPLLYYEFTLLRATLIVFCGLLLVFLLDQAREKQTTLPWLAVGVVLSLSLALKAHFVLLLLAAAVLLVLRCWKQWRRFGRCAGVFLGGLLIGFSPVGVRNLVVGVSPLVTATSGPPTFLGANAQDATYAGYGRRHAARILGQTSSAFLPTVIATLKTHPNLMSYLRLLQSKVLATWHWYEPPNNANFYYARLHSRLLRCLPVSFGLIGPPALVGLVLALPRFRRCAPLYLLVLLNLLVLYLFFVVGRFRLPLAAALVPFAGFTASRLMHFLCARRWSAAGATLAATALPALVALSPVSEGRPLVRLVDVDVGYRYFYGVKVQSALAHGDLNAAAEVLRESLSRQPAGILTLGPTRPARSVEEAELAAFYAEVYRDHALVLEETGHLAEAQQQRQRCAELFHASAAMLPADPM